jgi:Dullard-like phosphatase family protein
MMANECFEFLNFYYNSSIYCQLEKLFTNPIESNIVRISINYELLSIMICYDYSFEKNVLEKSFSILLNLIKLNYKNLIIICEHILNKVSNESINNIWVKKLANIINQYNKHENTRISNMSPVELINFNTSIILQNLRIILNNFKTMRNKSLSNYLNNICEQSYEQINLFFRDFVLRTHNLNGSILASVFLRNNTMFNTLPAPYVRTKNNKEFSLVLDLDETLVHFKEKMDGEGGGILRIRPGINDFLEQVGKYYELILFTTATQDYADLLIDAVEEDKIYFDHRLYREHAVIKDNDFVKDLNRIGRPLDKILIVDNMPQNFKLQKENGIMIKAFWGEDNYDTALIDLIPILVNIAKEGGDIREGLIKYKDEILKKVSSSISKENI